MYFLHTDLRFKFKSILPYDLLVHKVFVNSMIILYIAYENVLTVCSLTLSMHAQEGYSSRPVCLSHSDFGDY